jgi:hypothetical protein
MPDYLFDQKETQKDLQEFFASNKAQLTSFGNYVNQTFEAHAFAKVIEWYQGKGYKATIKNPKINGQETFRLKFSTRGTPDRFSYAVMIKDEQAIQIRHQLRIATAMHHDHHRYNANICCDVVVIKDKDLGGFSSDTGVPNEWLISFGEVKHMSAYAELVASFVGLVHELVPGKLKRHKREKNKQHISPFLFVSGVMNPTAKGLHITLQRRKYDIDIFSIEHPIEMDGKTKPDYLKTIRTRKTKIQEAIEEFDDLPF